MVISFVYSSQKRRQEGGRSALMYCGILLASIILHLTTFIRNVDKDPIHSKWPQTVKHYQAGNMYFLIS
jgi:hypothetical protein